ncbi:MAG: phage tail assembly protein [Halopseudomonas aestusnigri]
MDDKNKTDNVIELTEPATAHGKEITSITLRKPIGGDVIECGHPMTMISDGDGGLEMKINPRIIGKLISRLGDVPLSTVKGLEVDELMEGQKIIMSFFGNAQKT